MARVTAKAFTQEQLVHVDCNLLYINVILNDFTVNYHYVVILKQGSKQFKFLLIKGLSNYITAYGKNTKMLKYTGLVYSMMTCVMTCFYGFM